MRKTSFLLMIIASLFVSYNESYADSQVQSTSNNIKQFQTLDEAGIEYSKVLREILNYNFSNIHKNSNENISAAISNIDDEILTNKWENTNKKVLEQFEVKVKNVQDYGNVGEIKFSIFGYDEGKIEEYMDSMSSSYISINSDGDPEFDVAAYVDTFEQAINIQDKIEVGETTTKFVKSNNNWIILK